MSFLLLPQNLPFSVALALMFFIAVLEGTMTLLGMGLSNVLDSLLPDGFGDADLELDAELDLEIDGAAAIDPGAKPEISAVGEASGGSGLTRLLGWLCVGRVPVLVLLVVFLTAFGLIGLVCQGLIAAASGLLLPAWLAWLPAMLLSLPVVRAVGSGLARVVPKDETSAVSRDAFVGRVATITLGAARAGQPAQARLQDEHGRTHYVQVEPDSREEVFETGTKVLLVAHKGALFHGIRNISAALVDD
ncbi:MAG TPA: YqiJ family protein [Kiloniellaceae bacterium]|nr:YqiJ family protein [Kiloniellaceae bacterium]